MPNFDTIRLGAPFTAEVTYRGKTSELAVDHIFEFPVLAVQRADTKLVATFREQNCDGGDRTIEFLHFEGRLFRPFLVHNDPKVWTPDRCRREPPTIRLDDKNSIGGGFTSLLGSPFRRLYVWAKDNERQRALKASPQACRDAGRQLETLVGRGLRIVDGVLFQETRSPGWGVAARDSWSFVRASIPDLTFAPGTALLDPRYSADAIHRALARPRRDGRRSSIEVHDGSLLPATIEVDAIASLCIELYLSIEGSRFGQYEPRVVGEALLLVDAVERALKKGDPLIHCYEALERLAACRPDGVRSAANWQKNSSTLVEQANLFLDMTRAFPPISKGVVDEDDAEHIAWAFSH